LKKKGGEQLSCFFFSFAKKDEARDLQQDKRKEKEERNWIKRKKEKELGNKS
jgi:hypothetical protein